jgi:drug/metabolite transporter (DMT)-like permease
VRKIINIKTKGYIALATTSILWGTTWVASKMGVHELPALQMASIRQFIGGSCFLLFFIGYKKLPLPTTKQFGYIILLAILMFVGANGLSTWSLNYIPTGLSSLIGALYPLSVVLIEIIFYKKNNATPLTFLGMFLGIIGVGFVFYENAFQIKSTIFFYGLALSITAMLCWSFATVFISRSKMKLNAYYSAGLQMFVGSFFLFAVALLTKQTVPFASIPLKAWWVIAYLVIAGSIIAFIAFIYSLKVLPPAISSLYAYINPLVAMVVAYFVINEKLTWNILWGAIITLIGVYLVNYSIKRNDKKAIEQNEEEV